jgi:hypothetical protein
VLSDGPPVEVLNHYQKTVMEREMAYEEQEAAAGDGTEGEGGRELGRDFAPLRYTYRHGDGSAEIVSAELLDAARRPVAVVETGSPLTVRMRARMGREVDDAVFGFLVNDSRGVHAYGTNTKEQRVELGVLRRGELVEVSFAFDCWLGLDQFSVSLAVHSRDGVSYDWLDGVLFFRVTSPVLVEGIANLNATATARRVGVSMAGALVGAEAGQ